MGKQESLSDYYQFAKDLAKAENRELGANQHLLRLRSSICHPIHIRPSS